MKIENVKVISKLALQEINTQSGTLNIQGYVLETLGNYKQKIYVEVRGERIDIVTATEGSIVSVDVDASSREYNGRWYTTLRAWKFEAVGAAATPMAPAVTPTAQVMPAAAPMQPAPAQAQTQSAAAAETEGLPF